MTTSQPLLTRHDCLNMDAHDPLAALRAEFDLPEGTIYLDGNSLGALPKRVVARMQTAISDEWGKGLIRSWNDADWYLAPQRAGAAIARLIGAGGRGDRLRFHLGQPLQGVGCRAADASGPWGGDFRARQFPDGRLCLGPCGRNERRGIALCRA